jgi:hypothetical protein
MQDHSTFMKTALLQKGKIMRKSTIFISAALTTFALVMLYSVVSAYRGIVNTADTSAQPTEVVIEPTIVDTPVPTDVTPEQAAQLAAQVMGRNDLLSAESSSLNGVNAYKITFIAGDVVYVSTTGQILSIQTVPQVITVQVESSNRVRNKNKNNNTVNESHEASGEHEGD